MRTLHDIVEHFFLFLSFDSSSRFVASSLRRSKWIGAFAGGFANQNVTRVDFLFVFAVFLFGLALLELDNMEAKLRFHDVANLSGLQRKRGLLKFRHHLALTKPSQIAAFVFVARVSRKLFREFCNVFAGAYSLQNFFRLGAVLFARSEEH